MFEYNDVVFRAVEEFDLQTLHTMRQDEEINDSLFTLYPISMFSQKEWLKNMLSNSTSKVFMVDYIEKKQNHVEWQTNTVDSESRYTIGCVRLNNIDFINRKVEVGADIIKLHRGKGLGKKVYSALLKHCFEQMGVHQVYLYVLEKNERAIKCYESVGFKKVSVLQDWVWKNGSYQNVVLYSVLL